MDESSDEKARRVRSLLSSYYGSSGGGPGAPGGGSSASSAPSIDSATFDSDAYVRRLVNEMRLDGLQGKCVEMASEIKSLDSDMQMLVYENYSKFITATDTIRRMKSNVEGMEVGSGVCRGGWAGARFATMTSSPVGDSHSPREEPFLAHPLCYVPQLSFFLSSLLSVCK